MTQKNNSRIKFVNIEQGTIEKLKENGYKEMDGDGDITIVSTPNKTFWRVTQEVLEYSIRLHIKCTGEPIEETTIEEILTLNN